jgi:hypothetical protein
MLQSIYLDMMLILRIINNMFSKMFKELQAEPMGLAA